MKTIPRALTIVLLLVSAHASTCPLEGYWKSHEEKTLASFRSAKDTTAKQREILTKNFFGKLFIHIECDKFTTVMDGWMQTSSYKLLSSPETAVTIQYHSDLEGNVMSEAVIEDKCYSAPVNSGQFKEYFCPVNAEEFNKARRFAEQAVSKSP
ncbi:hypothetical protein [Pseudomonas paralcaligenes]|uniref:hypothetical protein n=1 Tax=Pseudomonas paralcaligenes TaxID=2772558 RepID=UPI001C8147DD|nr:hypothetical protein [Pseudomonas paralcaligenes]